LARQIERPEESSTLPAPELNPLLNPLLAQNMGRWAEVYFTSPPERREQAVLELLRELHERGEDSLPERTLSNEPSVRSESAPQTNHDYQSPRVPSQLVQLERVRCQSCGRELPATQKFCGMCGTRQYRATVATGLDVDSAAGEASMPERPVAVQPDDDWLERESSSFVNREPQYAPPPPVGLEPAELTSAPANPLSLFQTRHEDGDRYRDRYDDNQEIFSYPSASRPYRLYVGVALAIIIGVLGYMAWRSAQVASESSHAALPVAPGAPAQAAPAETSPTASNPATADKAPEQNRATSSQNAPSVPSEDVATKAPPNRVTQPAHQAAPKTTPIAASKTQPATATGAGAEELATALSYLEGINGQPRNGAEAAKWLWKSMAKHNASATILLADLYLKGDGVPKNCDQARVLLDSAARSGVKEAGERLRNLQAFGCQ
jgi:hypothetical protein